MAHDLWAELAAGHQPTGQRFVDDGDYEHPTASAVRSGCGGWVWCKRLINAARVRTNRRQSGASE